MERMMTMPSWRTAAQARLDAAEPAFAQWIASGWVPGDLEAEEYRALWTLLAHAPTDLRRALRLLADAGKMASGVKYALSNWQQSHIEHVDHKDVMDILDAFLAALDAEETP